MTPPVSNTVRSNVRDDAGIIRENWLKYASVTLAATVTVFGASMTLFPSERFVVDVALPYSTSELHARTIQVNDVEGMSHTAEFLLGILNEALMDFGIH